MPSTVDAKRRLLVLVTAAVFAACTENNPLEPIGPAEHQTAFSTATAASLVQCPSTVTRSTSGTVGILGGSLELDGTRVTVPFGAVLLPTTITLTLPASRYMEVDLAANLLDHIRFPVPVVVTIDYSRCAPEAFDDKPLHVWYIDDLTGALLENLGGSDDEAHRNITFTTIHFSGFSIAQ